MSSDIIKDNERSIIVSPLPFVSPKVMAVQQGASIKMIIDCLYNYQDVPLECRTYDIVVELNGEIILPDRWNIIPSPEDHVLLYIPLHGGGGGGGGKNPLRTILSLVVMVVAIVATIVAPYGAPAWWTGALGLSASSFGVAVGAVISVAGSLLINALFPIRTPSLGGDSTTSPSYSISGARNNLIPWGSVPVVLGVHKMYPPLGAKPYTEISGNDEYLRMLFIWGYGPLKIDDIKIGETPIANYEGVEIETREGRVTDTPITLIPSIVHQDQVGVELTFAGGRLVRSARPNVDEISVDVTCPAGLNITNSEGTRFALEVSLRVEYREIGAGAWTTLFIEQIMEIGTVTIADYTTYALIAQGIGGQFTQVDITRDVLYSIYLSETTGYISLTAGVAEIEGYYRIGTVTFDAPNSLTTTDLSPVDVTGMNVSHSEPIVTISSGSFIKVVEPFISIYENSTSPVRRGMRWQVDNTKNYEVGITRLTQDWNSSQIVGYTSWTVLRGFENDNPVSFPYPLAMTAIRIKASEQLQGVIDNLSGTVSSYGETWGGAVWGGEAVIQNPAALIKLVLEHPANSKPRTSAQINETNLGDFYDFCTTAGYKFNMIRDYKASVWDTVADIAAAGRGAPSLVDGTWGIIYDYETTPLIQHITPRNSWGFSADKVLFNPPHGFRVKFVNEDNDYAQDERTVYDDGYTASNATEFEGIEFPGITSPDLVWKFARYHIAQARLRPEAYTLFMDFEHLVCRRGSKVRISHDVPLWGSGWGRVKERVINPGDANKVIGVILDDYVTFSGGKTYACRFRLADAGNTSLVLSIVNPGSSETNTLTFTLEGGIAIADAPAVGDLAMFGETDNETVELLVKSIERSSEFVAKLTLVDVASAIYDADTGAIPPFDPQTDPQINYKNLPPDTPFIYRIESGTSALGIYNGAIQARMIVDITPQGGGMRVSYYRVRYQEVGTNQWYYVETPENNTTAIITEVQENITYTVQAQAVSIYGIYSEWSIAVTETVLGQEELPADITGFACNIIGANAYLSWDQSTEIDYSHCRIKWSDDTGGATWDSSIDLVVKVGKPATSITVPAMVGTYLIKAVDYRGNESENAALIITSIAQVSGLNAVETLSLPPWAGTEDGLWYGIGGFEVGAFDLPVDGLTANTDYRLRAYDIDSLGNIRYGETIDVHTSA